MGTFWINHIYIFVFRKKAGREEKKEISPSGNEIYYCKNIKILYLMETGLRITGLRGNS